MHHRCTCNDYGDLQITEYCQDGGKSLNAKDQQELSCLRMSIIAIKRQVCETLDAMDAKIAILLPEDPTPPRKYIKGDAKNWNHSVVKDRR